MGVSRWLIAFVVLYLLHRFVRSIGKVLAGIDAGVGGATVFLPLNGYGPPEAALLGVALTVVAALAWINDDGITKDVASPSDEETDK